MRVLITSGMYESGFALVHAMHRAGHEVHVLDTTRGSDLSRSRLVRSAERAPAAPPTQTSMDSDGQQPDAFSAAVARRVREVGADLVVPTVDDEVAALAVSREALATPDTLYAVPPRSAIAAAVDKYESVRTALRSGLVVPETRLVRTAGELRTAAEELGLPVFCKQRYSSGTHGVAVLRAWRDLDEVYSRLGAGELVVQAQVGGDREPSIGVVRSADGTVGPVISLRKHRYLNNSVSTAVRVVEPLPEADAVVDYFHQIGHVGFGAVQLREDRDGRHVFIESNLRWGANSRILLPMLRAQGIDLVGAFVDAHRGRPLRRVTPRPATGVSPLEDLLAMPSLVSAVRRQPDTATGYLDILRSYAADYLAGPRPSVDALVPALLHDPRGAWPTLTRALRERGKKDYSFLPLGELRAGSRASRPHDNEGRLSR